MEWIGRTQRNIDTYKKEKNLRESSIRAGIVTKGRRVINEVGECWGNRGGVWRKFPELRLTYTVIA